MASLPDPLYAERRGLRAIALFRASTADSNFLSPSYVVFIAYHASA